MHRCYHSWEPTHHPHNQAKDEFQKMKCAEINIPRRQHTTLIISLKMTVTLKCTEVIIPGRQPTTPITRLRTMLNLKCTKIIIPRRQHTALRMRLQTMVTLKCTEIIIDGRQHTALITRLRTTFQLKYILRLSFLGGHTTLTIRQASAEPRWPLTRWRIESRCKLYRLGKSHMTL